MNGEPGQRSGYRRRGSSRPYAAIAIAAGAAFAVVALLNAPGIAYVIVAVIAGACYSLTAVANRTRG